MNLPPMLAARPRGRQPSTAAELVESHDQLCALYGPDPERAPDARVRALILLRRSQLAGAVRRAR